MDRGDFVTAIEDVLAVDFTETIAAEETGADRTEADTKSKSNFLKPKQLSRASVSAGPCFLFYRRHDPPGAQDRFIKVFDSHFFQC